MQSHTVTLPGVILSRSQASIQVQARAHSIVGVIGCNFPPPSPPPNCSCAATALGTLVRVTFEGQLYLCHYMSTMSLSLDVMATL